MTYTSKGAALIAQAVNRAIANGSPIVTGQPASAPKTYDRAVISGNLDTVRASLEEWSLPRTHGSWAYANGTIAYSFQDEDGDGYCGYFCADCADRKVRGDMGRYVTLTALVTSEPDLSCDDCGEDLSN